MPIGLVCLRATMLRKLIARSQKSRGASRRKRSRAELKSLWIRCRDASPIERSYRVEEVVQFFPWYLGLHPAGIPHVELPRRLFISTLRGREQTRRRVEEKNEESSASLRSFKCHEPCSVLSLVSVGVLESSFLDT